MCPPIEDDAVAAVLRLVVELCAGDVRPDRTAEQPFPDIAAGKAGRRMEAQIVAHDDLDADILGIFYFGEQMRVYCGSNRLLDKDIGNALADAEIQVIGMAFCRRGNDAA